MKTKISVLLTVLCAVCTGWAYAAQPAEHTPLAHSSLMTDIASYKRTLIAVGEMGHVLYSKNNGESWEQGNVPVDNLLTAVTLLNESTAWAVGHDGVVLKTEDGGANWNLIYRTLDHTDSSFVDPLLDVTFWTEDQGISVGAFGQYFVTNDGGVSWQSQKEMIPNEDELHFNAILRTPANEIFIASEHGSLFYSADGGSNWQLITLPAEATFFSLAHNPDNQQVVIAGIAGNAFIFDIPSAEISPLAVRTEQSIYHAKFINQQLHIVGARGVWQRDNKLQIASDRTEYHAITQSEEGQYFVATASGIEKLIESKTEGQP